MWRRGLLLVLVLVGCGDDGAAPIDAPAPMPDAIVLPIVEAYGKAWDAEDAGERRRLLEYSAVETLAVYEPTRMWISRETVYAAMTDFHQSYPGATIPLVGNIRQKHDRVWLRWHALDNAKTELSYGFDEMKLAADHRIERVNSFYGSPPLVLGADTAVQQALIDAWNESDANARMTHLATAVTDDVVLAIESEAAVTTGRAALSTLIGDALTASPNRQWTRTSGYLSMPNAFHATWKTTASDGTTTLATGVMMAVLAGDGRVAELVVWNGTEP